MSSRISDLMRGLDNFAGNSSQNPSSAIVQSSRVRDIGAYILAGVISTYILAAL